LSVYIHTYLPISVDLPFIPFQVLSFTKSNCCDSIANNESPSVHPISIAGLSSLEAMLESYHKQQPKPKTV